MACFTFSHYAVTQSHIPVTGIKVLYNVPILKLNGELLNITDSFFVFYFKDFILYKTPYKHVVENLTTIESVEVKFKYFVHEKNGSFGFYYDSSKVLKDIKFSVDSFLKLKAFKGFNFYDRVNDSLIRKIQINAEAIEIYVPKVKYDQSYGDTTYIYYGPKLKDIEYSFSKELDSTKAPLKAYKVRIVYNSQFYTGYDFRFPRREYFFELREVDARGITQINSLFYQFEQYLNVRK